MTESDTFRSFPLSEAAARAAKAGHLDGARHIALALDEPGEQAGALAEAVTGPRAQVLIGQALQAGDGEPCLTTLAKITPAAVAAIVEEVDLLTAPS